MPLIEIKADSVDVAWQISLARLLKYGDNIKTEYDKPNDPPSKDATVAIEISNAFNHPFTMRGKARQIKSNAGNKWTIYGCDADTYLVGSIQSNYIEEIMDGINDHYIQDSEQSFPYSYHNRLFEYKPFALEDVNYAQHDIKTYNSHSIEKHKKLKVDVKENHILWEYRPNMMVSMIKGQKELFDPVYKSKAGLVGLNGKMPIEFIDFPSYNQIQPIIKKLATSPYSRRCQAVTWRQLSDQNRDDPPCLRAIWCRIINGKLKFQTTWRSRDLFRAWEANVNGMLYLQQYIVDEINREIEKRNKELSKDKQKPFIQAGSYTDISNSLHIYGSNFKELLELLERMRDRGDIHPELEAEIDHLRKIVETSKK